MVRFYIILKKKVESVKTIYLFIYIVEENLLILMKNNFLNIQNNNELWYKNLIVFNEEHVFKVYKTRINSNIRMN